MNATVRQPARWAAIVRSLRRKCPVCADSALSPSAVTVELECPNCGLNLERQVGSFIGGIGLNTTVTFILLVVMLVGGFIWTGGEASVTRILIPMLLIATLFPLWFFVRSRLLWVALELIWWPLEENETTQVR